MRTRRSRLLLLAFLATAILLIFTHGLWLRWAGELLVESQAPEPADAVFVLAGDHTCLRIFKAAELVKAGFAPRVLVSGATLVYGHPESELAIECATAHGYPSAWFIPVQHEARSTTEEAGKLKPDLERLGVRRLIVVTSNFHTGRSGRTLRKVLGPEYRVTMVSAPDESFSPDSWWENREARKKFLVEWMKTAAAALGI